MSNPLLLRAFVEQRLTAAAEEIFQVFEQTITKYEEEVSSSKQEIERLRGLLLELVSNHRADVPQASICKEETPPEQLGCDQQDTEPQRIKEEAHELWASGQENRGEEVAHADVSYLSRPCLWQEDKRSPLQPQTKAEQEEVLQEETVQVVLPLTSAPSPQTQSVQDGQNNRRPTASLTSSQTLMDHSQSPLISAKDSTELSTPASTESLSVHLKSHRGSKCCHVCGKQFSRSTPLAEHMASHAGVKLHRCMVCGKECSQKGDLKIHMRIHTGEKPYCCSFCDKSFTHSGHLRKHMRSHTGERPHMCHLCGRGFLQSAHLKDHLWTHVKQKVLC